MPSRARVRATHPLPLLLLLVPTLAFAGDGHGLGGQALLALALILGAARLGGHAAQRLGQPPVLGELLAGVALGNLGLLGVHGLAFMASEPAVQVLAELGVILLLFEVGLESTVAGMARVGRSAMLAATLGVILPMILGFGVGVWLLPQEPFFVHLFLGATLTATSVGITARVLKDLGEHQSPEARVILGAAVIDDVLGLIILAAVTGLIEATNRGVAVELGPIAWIVGKATLFLGGAVGLGVALTPWLYRQAAKLEGTGVLLGVSLAFCFALAWAASAAGLAPIVGAFAAGLVLESAHYRPFIDRGEAELEELVHPVVAWLGPIFFVLMGMRVDLGAFASVSALGLAAALTVAAVVGKFACGLGVLDPGIRRLPVALGMAPRGEVGLIFANIGLGLTVAGERVISPTTYTAVVMVVIVTTLFTPLALTLSLKRR